MSYEELYEFFGPGRVTYGASPAAIASLPLHIIGERDRRDSVGNPIGCPICLQVSARNAPLEGGVSCEVDGVEVGTDYCALYRMRDRLHQYGASDSRIQLEREPLRRTWFCFFLLFPCF